MASYTANDMRVGWAISHNGKRYTVTSITKVKPGKGGAFVQADLRDIDTGNKGGDRWRAEDKVEKLMVEDVDCQFLYSDGTNSYFMNLSDYEQFTMVDDSLGEQMKFLKPEMTVKTNFVEGLPISITLPKTVIATIEETEPALRGQTISGSGGKPAILDNGVRVQVPVFVEQGERIVVNTETLEYVERAK
ncbi:MAG: elongation factor P [Alphaproteobacteria bacterium]|nr:elongation factor P [Alphaproteobacteria bacterium]MBN2675151.1 elongation factor P [Alphaproteobacteria bacterium]